MDRITVDLEHCYGIKKLSFEFDFSKERVFALYAPNGAMKSSFAQAFHDVSKGVPSRDRIFSDRACKRAVLDENGDDLTKECVFVVRPYDAEFAHSEKTSILLVEAALRKEYEEIHAGVVRQKNALLTAIKKKAGSKRDFEREISTAFTASADEFETALYRIAKEMKEQKDAVFADIPYDTVFDDKVLEFLRTSEAQAVIEIYVKRYNELLAASTYFKKGTFDYYNAGQIAKSLADNGFFAAKHTVNLNAATKIEIKTQKELEDLIASEKEAILKDKELRKRFDALAKLLDKNTQLREFRSFMLDHEAFVSQLKNVPKFKENLLKSYLKICYELYAELMKEFEASKARAKEIEAIAAKQRTQWETVINIFNERFVVPFTLHAKNRTAVMLGDDTIITLGFTYRDGQEERSVERAALLEALSTGEKKALYVLNVIFEIETRRKNKQETLIIVDDLADSFDYQNKYAIIQYLREIGQDPLFKLIILTHNFDFFRTINSRFVSYPHCLMAAKTAAGVSIGQASGIKNVFVNDWKVHFFDEPKKKIASIPFMRNLVEYTSGESHPAFQKLTSLLHWKADSETIAENELDRLYGEMFGVKPPTSKSKKTVLELITEQAALCLKAASAANFENKIVLAIAIRLAAEKYMVGKIADPTFAAGIQSNQTQELLTRFKACGSANGASAVLDRVVTMTPENIHLNSFMYEPIVDMSDEHLRKLYSDVLGLN
jgi:hypothetical protein